MKTGKRSGAAFLAGLVSALGAYAVAAGSAGASLTTFYVPGFWAGVVAGCAAWRAFLAPSTHQGKRAEEEEI